MKGKTLVIGLIIFVIIVVGAIYFLMMSTINNIKEEQGMSAIEVVHEVDGPRLNGDVGRIL